jgi:hypothetical protein
LRVGSSPSGYPSTSYKTRIPISSGPFSAAVEAYGQNYAMFLHAMRELHRTLVGEVRLNFWNEAHAITFTGGGKGGIELTTKIKDNPPFGATLIVPMLLDQSYLPEIIRKIACHFPE